MTSQTTKVLVEGEKVFRKIPVPVIATFPILSWSSFFPFSTAKIPSLYQSKNISYFTAARYALFQALKEIDVRENDEILVPAYHCKAMIYPIIDAGCLPVFYKIKEDFSADIDDLKELITKKSKAVIAVNYFGFFQNMQEVRKACNQNNLKLIEDCAHSLFGSNKEQIVGQTGDYAIGSTKKFFPVKEGGILTSNLDIAVKKSPGIISVKSEVRFIYNILEKSLEHGRLWLLKPFVYFIEKSRGLINRPVAQISPSNSSDNGQEDYHPNEKTRQPTRLSILLENFTSHHRIYIKRRENYAYLANALKNNENITVVIPDIPSGTVPYMFPVKIKNLEKIFPKIEDEAIPYQRFGQFLWQGSERCPVSQNYAETILQLPCHQELSKSELQWIVEKLNSIIGKSI